MRADHNGLAGSTRKIASLAVISTPPITGTVGGAMVVVGATVEVEVDVVDDVEVSGIKAGSTTPATEVPLVELDFLFFLFALVLVAVFVAFLTFTDRVAP
jgi:hypothetical protein